MLISVLFEEQLLERDLDFIVFVGRIIIEIWGIWFQIVSIHIDCILFVEERMEKLIHFADCSLSRE